MQLEANTHVAVVDGERFVLMRNAGTASEPRLEFESEPTVSDHNKSAGMRHQDELNTVSNGTATSEPHDKFAHAAGIAEWLNKAVLDRRVESLVVVADERTLGELRKNYSQQTQAALAGELGKELANRPGPDILAAIVAAD